MSAEELTLEKILFGDSEREDPDQIDRLVLHAMREIDKANGGQGATMVEVAEHLLDRKLSPDEVDLVAAAEFDE